MSNFTPESIWRSREEIAKERGFNITENDLPEVMQRLFLARQLEFNETLFSPKLSQLKDPTTINGISSAVTRLVQAFKQQEKICIYADFDLDGTSGLALFLQGLKSLGYQNIVGYQPKRLSEGYGFHANVVEELHQMGVSLIVTVDVGITALEACAKAKELGVEVIITDHHLPADKLPDAQVIINPNLPDDKSGLGYLCGAGVAFYLLRALFRGLVDEQLVTNQAFDLKDVLEFFTIGTLTDMVPLIEDNRILVKYGLKALEKTTKPGLRALLNELGLEGKALSSQDVAIRFAPKLNALSRMEMGLRPVDIMIETDEQKALQLISQVLDNNLDRVNLQQQGEAEANDLLMNWEHPEFVFVTSKNFHRGVVGLIATKLAQNYNVPAFVGSESEDGLVVGSCRVPAGSPQSLIEALESARNFLNRFGGHRAAAGFEFHSKKFSQIKESLVGYFSSLDLSSSSSVIHEYDMELPLSVVNYSLIRWLDALGPYGQSFPSPLFAFKEVKILNAYELKGGHRKYRIQDDKIEKPIEALYFSPPSFSYKPKVGDVVEVLGEIQTNYYRSSMQVQILIKDIRVGNKS